MPAEAEMCAEETDSPSDLFDTQLTRATSALPKTLRPIFERLLDENAGSDNKLPEAIDEHLAEVKANAQSIEFIDVTKAESLAQRCHCLLAVLASTDDDDSKRLIRAAIAYFIQREDGEDDLSSPIGFDDDEIILDAVYSVLKIEEK
jgi:hypothetical protein